MFAYLSPDVRSRRSRERAASATRRMNRMLQANSDAWHFCHAQR